MTNGMSLADRIGVGLLSGLIGTIVMTLGQEVEMALTKRPPSATPAKAVEKLSGVELRGSEDEQRASTPIHYAYGTALGAALALLDEVREPARTAAFFAFAFGGGAALLAGLKLAPLPTGQKPAEVAIDVGHHLVYALSASAACALLTRGLERSRR